MAWAGVDNASCRREPHHLAARVRARQHHNGAAFAGRRSHLWRETAGLCRRDQILGQRARDLADGCRAGRLEDIEPAQLCVHRQQRRRAALEASGVVVRREVRRVEGELVAVCEPPGRSGAQFVRAVAPGVEEADTRASQQPLEPAGTVEIDAQRRDVDRNLSRGLIAVGERERTVSARDRGENYLPGT